MRLTLIALLASVGLTTLQGCALVAGGAAATGIMMAEDRRTSASYLMDEEIELKSANRLRELKIDGVHANFTSFNRRVLITGEVPNEAVKTQVGELVRNVPNVVSVFNEAAVAAPSSISARASDGYITAKVKARFLDDKTFNAAHVKVVTENATVYLLGLVSRAEAQSAADLTAKTAGVKRVVKVFEYTD